MRTSGIEEMGRMTSIAVSNNDGGGLEASITVWTAAELMNYMKNPRLAMGSKSYSENVGLKKCFEFQFVSFFLILLKLFDILYRRKSDEFSGY